MVAPLRTAHPTARKRHQCDTCCRWISAGDRYQYTAYVDGADFWTSKMHMRCAAMASISFDRTESGEEGMLDYELREDAWWAARDHGWREFRAMVQERMLKLAPTHPDTTEENENHE